MEDYGECPKCGGILNYRNVDTIIVPYLILEEDAATEELIDCPHCGAELTLRLIMTETHKSNGGVELSTEWELELTKEDTNL